MQNFGRGRTQLSNRSNGYVIYAWRVAADKQSDVPSDQKPTRSRLDSARIIQFLRRMVANRLQPSVN